MKRLLLLLAVLAPTAALLGQGVPSVHACSVGPEFDLVKDSEVIVGGRFTGWELGEDEVLPPEFYDAKESNIPLLDYATVTANMKVDRVYKGKAGYEIEITSGNTLQVYDHEPKYVWIGPSGACGAFGSDPTGVYAIMGLSNDKGDSVREFLPL